MDSSLYYQFEDSIYFQKKKKKEKKIRIYILLISVKFDHSYYLQWISFKVDKSRGLREEIVS